MYEEKIYLCKREVPGNSSMKRYAVFNHNHLIDVCPMKYEDLKILDELREKGSIVYVIPVILASVKANNGEYRKYPLTIQFIR